MSAVLDRIGLLFVHGIGEQKRFDHLRNSCHEYAELLRQIHGDAVVTIVDRTDDWPFPAETPSSDGTAPITIQFQSGGDTPRRVHFHCQEVWWADLGTRSGLLDVTTFWLWGLGQWGAPMYREIDASGLPKDATAKRADDEDKPVPSLTRLPRQLAGDLIGEPWVRVRLAAAALGAALITISWVLVKRAFQALLSQAPSPTLLVQYVGDVRTYESRWRPGDSNLSDPGHPRRVAIRRRMVSEMVAMGAQAAQGELDGWYVCAHSLGTVVAYNGLTEIAHALPNYLSQAQWQALPVQLKHDSGCEKRAPADMHNMMPSRPDWLAYEHVINRPLLFRKLRGILTYGSPLDKFAALWPRIVATATDRKDAENNPESPFRKGCEWINLSAPQDPVAGTLDSYHSDKVAALEGSVPKVYNVVTPVGASFGLAHIRYFSGVPPEKQSKRDEQKRAIMRWLLQEATEPFEKCLVLPEGELVRRDSAWSVVPKLTIGYTAILALLSFAAGLFWWIVFHVSGKLVGGSTKILPGWYDLLVTTDRMVGAGLTVVLLFGLLRWFSESRYSRHEAAREHARTLDPRQPFSLWQAFRRQMAVYGAAADATKLARARAKAQEAAILKGDPPPEGDPEQKRKPLHHWIFRLIDAVLPQPRGAVLSRRMESYWRWIFWLFFWQALVALLFLIGTALVVLLLALGFVPHWSGLPSILPYWLAHSARQAVAIASCWASAVWPIGAAALLAIASIAQTLLNKIVPAAKSKTSNVRVAPLAVPAVSG